MKIRNMYICTPLTSPAPSDKKINMHQLKPIKHIFIIKHEQLDDTFLSVGVGDVNGVQMYTFCIFIHTIWINLIWKIFDFW